MNARMHYENIKKINDEYNKNAPLVGCVSFLYGLFFLRVYLLADKV